MSANLTFTPTLDIRRLAAWRRSVGLTQAQLGERIGCRADDIARFERAVMPGELADRIAEGLTEAAEGTPK